MKEVKLSSRKGHYKIEAKTLFTGGDIVKTASERFSAALNKAVLLYQQGFYWDYIPEINVRTIQWACEELTHPLIQRKDPKEGR